MPVSRQDILDALADVDESLRQVRQDERKFKQIEGTLANSPLALKGRMAAILPKQLVAQNVGKRSRILWPQMYEFTIDYSEGANAVIRANDLPKRDSIQVTQGAAFLLTGLHRDAFSIGACGNDAPLGLTLRDESSTRTLNKNPIPLQAIGKRMRPFRFDVPFLVHANASLSLEMKSLWPTDIAVNGVSGIHKIVASGYRIYEDDIASVMKALYL